jgi:hypothetical protein
MAHRALLNWLTIHDILYVGQMPLLPDYSHLLQVALASEYVDLFDTHALFLPFMSININSSSTNMVVQCMQRVVGGFFWSLRNQPPPSLLQQVKQTYDSLPLVQRSGLSLYKLKIDHIDLRSFKSVQGLVSFLSSFDLHSFDSENLSIATSCFKAVMMTLPTSSVPANVLEFYLQGMAKASSEEFKEVCSSLWGSINSPMYGELAHRCPVAFPLDSFAWTLLAKYSSLCAINKWSGVERKASAFKAALVSSSHRPGSAQPSVPADSWSQPNVHKDPSYEAWFDAQKCENCGGSHPTQFHNDPGAHDHGGK